MVSRPRQVCQEPSLGSYTGNRYIWQTSRDIATMLRYSTEISTYWSQDKMTDISPIFKSIFLYENVLISLRKSLKFIPNVRINNISALGQIMACRRSCDEPLSEAMMVSLLTQTCVTRSQWVNVFYGYTQFCQQLIYGLHWFQHNCQYTSVAQSHICHTATNLYIKVVTLCFLISCALHDHALFSKIDKTMVLSPVSIWIQLIPVRGY